MNPKSKRKTQTQTPLTYKKTNYPKPSHEEKEEQIQKVKDVEDRVLASKLDPLSREQLLEQEANFLVGIINHILENEDQQLKEEQKGKLNEFLLFIGSTGVKNLTVNEITSMRNYIISLNNRVDLNEDYFSESKIQTKSEAEDLIDYIQYMLKHKTKLLSDAQKTQLNNYKNIYNKLV